MKIKCLPSLIVIVLSFYFCEGTANIKAQEKPESTDKIVYTILCNNTSNSDSIFADHGFSCLIEAGAYAL